MYVIHYIMIHYDALCTYITLYYIIKYNIIYYILYIYLHKYMYIYLHIYEYLSAYIYTRVTRISLSLSIYILYIYILYIYNIYIYISRCVSRSLFGIILGVSILSGSRTTSLPSSVLYLRRPQFFWQPTSAKVQWSNGVYLPQLQFFVGKIWENDEKNYDENHGVAFFWPIFRQSRMYDWEGSLHLSKGTTFSGCSTLPLARKHPLTYHISLSPALPYLPNQGSPKSNVKENKTASPCTIYQVCTYSQSSEEFPPLFQPWNNKKNHTKTMEHLTFLYSIVLPSFGCGSGFSKWWSRAAPSSGHLGMPWRGGKKSPVLVAWFDDCTSTGWYRLPSFSCLIKWVLICYHGFIIYIYMYVSLYFILMFYASHSSSYDRFLTWGHPKMDGL